MAKNKNGQTAFGAAATRWIEQYQPPHLRLFTDDVLQYLLPRAWVILLKLKWMRDWTIKICNQQVEGIFGELLCRTKYFDEKSTSIPSSIEQILILGAGLDTRPYRLAEWNDKKIFEADLASVQNIKKKKIKKHFGVLLPNIVYVAIDFDRQSLREVLSPCGFDFTKPAFIIWEGVTQYLTQTAVEQTLAFVASLAEGSCLVFTYVLDSVIKKQSALAGANELMNYFEKKNIIWQFGLEPKKVESFLAKYHLQLLEDAGADYYRQRYLQPAGRNLAVTQMERAALAKLKP